MNYEQINQTGICICPVFWSTFLVGKKVSTFQIAVSSEVPTSDLFVRVRGLIFHHRARNKSKLKRARLIDNKKAFLDFGVWSFPCGAKIAWIEGIPLRQNLQYEGADFCFRFTLFAIRDGANPQFLASTLSPTFSVTFPLLPPSDQLDDNY
eukprot:c1706_g1_i1.p1 GENE.c1706_g1_i1~~c1706_g1_i1.p1  ORF type:complete len:151 (-),score=24.73 c1706_g1_i1:64-516(-)